MSFASNLLPIIPDHVFVDALTGQPSDQTLSRYFGLNRDTRRALVSKFHTKYKKSLVKSSYPEQELATMYAGSESRNIILLLSLEFLIQGISKVFNESAWRSKIPCMELFALIKYRPDLLSSDFLKIKIKPAPQKPKSLQAIFDKLCETTQSQFFSDLSNFSSLSEESRKLLAETLCAFAYSSESHVTKAFEVCPELKNYFSFFYNSLRKINPTELSASVDQPLQQGHQNPQIHQDWLSLIQKQFDTVKQNPSANDQRSAFIDLVNQYDQWASKNHTQEAIKHFNSFIDFLLNLAEIYNVIDLSTPDYHDHYRCLWAKYLNSIPHDQNINFDLVSTLNNAATTIVHLQSKQNEILSSIESLESSKTELFEKIALEKSAIASRKLNKIFTELERDLADANLAKQNLEDEKITALLPPDHSIDDLDCEGDANTLIEDLPFYVKEHLSSCLEWITHKSSQYSPEVDAPVDFINLIDYSHNREEDSSESGQDPTSEFAALLSSEQTDSNDHQNEQFPDDVDLNNEYSSAESSEHSSPDQGSTDITTDLESNTASENYVIARDSIPNGEINRQISRLILDMQIESASQLAYSSTTEQMAFDVIPYQLLKAAFYGMHTFDNRTVFNKARKALLEYDSIRDSHQLPDGEVVNYLVLIAALQPVLFGGNQSSAVALLREIPDGILDEHLKSIIKEAIDFCNRGEVLSVQQIRAAGQKNIVLNNFSPVAVDQWIQKIKDSRRGYALILKSQAYCLENGIFGEITEILIKNDRSRISVVEQFVNEYQDIEDTSRLLDETLTKIDAKLGEGITRIGRQRFHNKVMELVDIVRDWLNGVNRSKVSVADDFCKKFVTRVTNSITHYTKIASEDKTLGRRAGARFVANRLTKLLQVVQDNVSPWSEKRVIGWYLHPSDIARLRMAERYSERELVWWLLQLSESTLATDENAALAMDSGNLRLSQLIKMEQDINDSSLSLKFERYRISFKERIRDLERKLSEGVLSGYIDSTVGSKFSETLGNVGDLLDQIDILDDISSFESEIDSIALEVSTRLIDKKFELRTRYTEAFKALHQAIPDEPVPPSWMSELEQAFSDDNLSVVDEMLEELDFAVSKQRKITVAKTENPPILRNFVSCQNQLYKRVHDAESTGWKSVWSTLTEGDGFGLGIKTLGGQLKKAITALCEWQKAKPKNAIDKDLYDNVVIVLEQVGIIVSEHQFNGTMKDSLAYRTGPGFCLLYVSVDQSLRYSKRPFAAFGMGKVRHLPVLIAHGNWEPDEFFEFLDAMNINFPDAVLISSVSMSSQQRNQFAKLSKQKKRMVLHIDPVALLYLASLDKESSENIAIKNFLWLTAPYTYFNPYGGDTLRPPLPEMRYGRENLITDLARMDGPAIVYGGRQLGKSTLLQDVQLRVDSLRHNVHAFYEMLDKNLYSRGDLSKNAHGEASKQIWRFFYHNMKSRRLIPLNDSSEKPDEMKDAVKQALISNKEASVIGILDEIDPILILDSAYDFSIFRGLRDLIANPNVQGRFKVIIGGLENVKRFENSPNYPLTQMGGTIQVTIMATQEALQLVVEPLRAAGYHFEQEAVAKRILAITNRHPGLIQVFCHELIDFLGTNSTSPVGEMVIRVEDVEAVARMKHVGELIRKRFDMTLDLDSRYQVIIYSLINERQGSNPFDSQTAKQLAETWLPNAFTQLSNRQFEAFMDELVGLGVLRKNNDGRFAIRNTNVLRLLADSQFVDIENQLETAIRNFVNTDPLDRHAFNLTNLASSPSPLTYRDEMALIGRTAADEKIKPTVDPKQYSVSIIVGSDAQGFTDIMQMLPGLYEAESIARGTETKRYKDHRYAATDYQNAADFEKRVLTGLFGTRSNEAPQMVVIDVLSQATVPNVLAMLDAAHRISNPPKHPVRLVFLFHPGFYWKWLQASQYTAAREQQQAFIKLGNWKESAIKALMTQLEMNDSNYSVQEALSKTEGWYFSIKILAAIKRENRGKMELSEFGKKFVPLDQVDRTPATKILNDTGFNSVSWSTPLLREASRQKFESLDADTLELISSELQIEFNQTMIRWMVDLGFLKPVSQNGKTPTYQISSAINHALRITS